MAATSVAALAVTPKEAIIAVAWDEAHPDITLNQNVLANAEYKTQIATLAAAGDLQMCIRDSCTMIDSSSLRSSDR